MWRQKGAAGPTQVSDRTPMVDAEDRNVARVRSQSQTTGSGRASRTPERFGVIPAADVNRPCCKTNCPGRHGHSPAFRPKTNCDHDLLTAQLTALISIGVNWCQLVRAGTLSKPLQAIRPNSSSALERLRDLIGAHEHAGDNQLPTERELAEQLGVGRSAVRRALEVLEAEGRIWRRQGSGTFVSRSDGDAAPSIETLTDKTNFFEVMEARLRVEPGLAQLAALRASAAEVERMRKLAAKAAASTDGDALELWDSALHRQIAMAAGNSLLLALFDVIDKIRQDNAWRRIRDLARNSGNLDLYAKQHQEIVVTIADRDPAEAEAAMRRHILTLQQSLFIVTTGALSHAS